jgi:adenylate cyclase
VKLKGKTLPIRVYELIAEKTKCPPDKLNLLTHFTEGIELYFSRSFEAAKRKFEDCLALDSTDFLSKLYIQRCEDYLQSPPSQDWDGVFEMKSK